MIIIKDDNTKTAVNNAILRGMSENATAENPFIILESTAELQSKNKYRSDY